MFRILHRGISFGFLVFHFPVFQAISEGAFESRHCGFSVGAAMITNMLLPRFATVAANVSISQPDCFTKSKAGALA